MSTYESSGLSVGGPPVQPSEGRPEADDASGRAQQVAGTAAEEGQRVAGVAVDEAKQVAGEARQQAMGLMQETRSQLDEQARTQRDRLVGTLRTATDDLERMASNDQGAGMAADLVRQAAERARGFADRIDGREPSDLLEELRGFARRRPGTFLVGALAAGVVVGRLTRGARDASTNGSESSQLSSASARPVSAYPPVPYQASSEPPTQPLPDALRATGYPASAEGPLEPGGLPGEQTGRDR